MPTKICDWKCDSCRHTWEYLHHGSDQDPVSCPNCDSMDIEMAESMTTNITTCHDPTVLKETLKKRSADHTRRLVQSQAGHGGSLPPNFGKHHVEPK